MAISVTGIDPQRRRGDRFGAKDTLTSATATGLGTISTTTDVSTLSGSTATGFTVNRWSLGAGLQGQEKTVILLATDEAYIEASTPTATGAYVLTEAGDFVFFKYLEGSWRTIQNGGATIATATMTA